MRLIFAGTPPFAATILSALIPSTHEILVVLTRPDRPVGRGRKVMPSPVKQTALASGIDVHQPFSLRKPEIQQMLRSLNADLMVVVAYGLILPAAVLEIPRYGCVNVHASLLPRWRGAAPIHYALLAGDAATGVSIMQMDTGLDTGPVLASEPCPINSQDTAQTLHDRLATVGADVLLRTLEDIENGTATAVAQPPDGVTYAPKISKQQGLLDWTSSAAELERCVRAYNPWPVAYTLIDGIAIRIWKAAVVAGETVDAPGTVIDVTREGIDVAAGRDVLRILEIQLPGGRRLPVAEFINADRGLIVSGVRFKSVAMTS